MAAKAAPRSESPLSRFQLAPSVATPRLLWSSSGDVGTGKTYFGLTGPAPIVVFSFDDGTEGVVEQFREQNDKEIRISRYDWTPADVEEGGDPLRKLAIALRTRYVEELTLALQHARTILTDKETDLWNMIRYSFFGAPKADVPRDFDGANQFMRKYLQLPKKTAVNFGALQSVRDEWASQNKKTGGTKRAGFGETPGLMNVDLYHEREKGQFFTTVLKARGPNAAAVQDQRYPNLDIPTLGQMLFPETEAEDWA